MTEEQFWSLIEAAREGSDASANPARMTQTLTPLSDDEVSDFGLMFYDKVCQLNDWKSWAAGYVITDQMSQDYFHYFRSWIIGKGQNVFQAALNNPDDLAPYIDDPSVHNESLEYVTIFLLKARGSNVDPRERSTGHPDGRPSGEPFMEGAVAHNFPKLAARFK